MIPPDISIINLCYNTGARICATLDSIKQQTIQNFEIIIVDDASTDNSVIIIEQWLQGNANVRAKLVRNDTNLGITKSLNKALALCEGKYISIIGDDILNANFLARQLPLIESSKNDTALIFSNASSYHVESGSFGNNLDPMVTVRNTAFTGYHDLFMRNGESTFLLRQPFLHDMLLHSNFIVVFTAILKKDILIANGGFDEAYMFEDYPLWLNLSRYYNFIYVDETLGCYLQHSTGFTVTNHKKLDLEILKLLNSYYSTAYKAQTLFTLQNRIVTILTKLYKLAFRKRDMRLVKSVAKESIKFLSWPGFVTEKYLLRKIRRKVMRSKVALA